MKRMLMAMLTVVVVLSALSTSAYAGPPTPAAGLWQYTPYIEAMRVAGGNTFLDTVEDGVWTGSFVGISTEDGEVVIHRSGFWSFRCTVSFVGFVEGKEGTLEMRVVGKRADALADWEGKWVITGGTGDLANLHGQGTFWGPGAPAVGEQGDIHYSGQIHFDPN